MIESRPNKRLKATPSASQEKALGNIITKRETLDKDEIKIVIIPSGVRFAVFKNQGSSDLRFQMGVDNTQYYTLNKVGEVGQVSPVFNVDGDEEITIESTANNAILECIFWG